MSGREGWHKEIIPLSISAQQPAAGDGLQRSLVPRSRCLPRLSRSVRRRRDFWDLQSHSKRVTLLCVP
jgi:hypothetical protein